MNKRVPVSSGQTQKQPHDERDREIVVDPDPVFINFRKHRRSDTQDAIHVKPDGLAVNQSEKKKDEERSYPEGKTSLDAFPVLVDWPLSEFSANQRRCRVAHEHGGKGCHGNDIRKENRYHQGSSDNVRCAAEPEFFLCFLFTQYPVEQSAISFGKQRPLPVIAIFDEANGEKQKREQKNVQNGRENTDENNHPQGTQMDGFAQNLI